MADRFVCLNCMNRYRLRTGSFPLWSYRGPGKNVTRTKVGEHIEIVLPGDPETLNARALALLSDEGLSLPGISVKTSSPKVSMNDYRIRRWRSPMVKTTIKVSSVVH